MLLRRYKLKTAKMTPSKKFYFDPFPIITKPINSQILLSGDSSDWVFLARESRSRARRGWPNLLLVGELLTSGGTCSVAVLCTNHHTIIYCILSIYLSPVL